MKRKNIMICLIIGMILIVSLNVLINYPSVKAGRWRYNTTVEDVYNITISSDDAVNVMDNYFSSTGETIALKIGTYDIMTGLRFDNISIPNNATHNYLVVNAYISLYSDQYPYESDSGALTIYYQRYSWNISTFKSYIDLTQRIVSSNSRNWNLDNVHGLNSTTGQWNDSPNIAILISEAIEWDNNTIALILLSESGDGFRYFRTIDSSSNYAPRLHIISQIYTYQESPPSGYEEYDYEETYKDIDIWYKNTMNWLDYELFTEIDPANKFTVANSTYVYTTQDVDGNDNVKLVVTDDSKIFDIKFGIKVTYFHDEVPDAERYWIYLFGGRELQNYAVDDWDCDFFWIGLISDETESKIEPFFSLYDGSFYQDKLGIEYTATWMRWNHFTFDINTKAYSWKMYIDKEMTNLDAEISGTHTKSVIGSEYVYALNTYDFSYGSVDKGQFEYFSVINEESYLLTDEDGNIIDIIDVDDIEDVYDWIDNYLGASPEYDKTPWMGDFTLLLVGLVGVAFIPLGFLIFVSSVRDGDIIGGLQTLVIMFFIGIGCIITWLWA